ncbi:cupin domain-containing protein [Mesorhizobium sp. B2-5-13]|uniref:cupin domain-containing protein n=1 Tax=unclassified Mesorhizobium TaxID=325217 RepID=UPI00112A0F33|nr:MULTISPECIES: cupin domain-containing protein [unclassified Mesorhizobium]TPJ78784.1 cupin domain-containing protein [Mesorhizobium sp. B2-5-13]TPK45008.1 cupin domain-containing protein [Mesorhizobium sp. B2-5-5]
MRTNREVGSNEHRAFKEIGYVKQDQLVQGPITPGQNRRKALEAGNLWVGQCHVTALDAPSQLHHHQEFDSVMYMLSGRIRVDFGEIGERSFEIGEGDYAYFPRRAIHRCQILEGGDDVHYVFVRVGEGETVVNVDGPGALAPEKNGAKTAA